MNDKQTPGFFFQNRTDEGEASILFFSPVNLEMLSATRADDYFISVQRPSQKKNDRTNLERIGRESSRNGTVGRECL